MGRNRHTQEQIIAELRQAEVPPAVGQALAELARKLETAEQTARLKKLMADQALNDAILTDVASGHF
jgi:hypothetical protein